MGEGGRPAVFSIPVYRAFGDALVTGLIAQTRGDRLALARGMIIAPNNRAKRSITQAFVRRSEQGLLLPRIVAIGDAGEAPGLGLDAIDSDVPPAVDPLTRRLILARLVQQDRAVAGAAVTAAEAFRLASELASTLDELIAEDVAPARLRALEVGPELAVHWQKSIELFAGVVDRWPEELARLGCIDLPERRNRLLRALARRWRDDPPGHFVLAAGVTTAAPAIAKLLRVVSRMPHGSVVLPGVDLASPDAEWDAIGGVGDKPGIETHPQHHLRLLLDRMDVARAEVVRWRWGDGRARKAVRGRAVSNAFAPASFTAKWATLPAQQRKLEKLRGAVFANAADEAQGIAIALRESLEVPGRTAALVTPDRMLAARVATHLKRWGIDADDSAGQPLGGTPPGILIQAVVQLALDRFAPVALLAVLKHPLVMSGEGRAAWLAGARLFDLALRGPRPAAGLAGLAAYLAAGDERERRVRAPAHEWWRGHADLFQPLEAAFTQTRPRLDALLDAVAAMLAALTGDAVWAGPAGREAAQLFEDLRARSPEGPSDFVPDDLLAVLRQLLGEVAVRPPQGGHPRIAIWGLLEARLQQADLIVLGSLNEGVWPAQSAADPWLSPRVRRELGLADPERRVGLAAHDLASALGASEVLLTRAARDARSPTIASRFWLRLEAMTDEIKQDERLIALATMLDAATTVTPASRPAPSPPVEERPRRISVTQVDRLQADPFAFYAGAMLRLSPLDAIDAEPGPAWRGSAVHRVLDQWLREDALDPARLVPRVERLLADAGTHPIVRTLWQPRLVAAVEWIAEQIAANGAIGRVAIASEIKGAVEVGGVSLSGIADRIDCLADGSLAVVDYKTGKAPSSKAVAAGYAMQLGLLALIAQRGGFDKIAGTARVFEYWSLASDGEGGFGKVASPVTGRSAKIAPDDFVEAATRVFEGAARRWLTGGEPFVAKLNPEYAPYEDYDQLMRRDEWYGRDD